MVVHLFRSGKLAKTLAVLGLSLVTTCVVAKANEPTAPNTTQPTVATVTPLPQVEANQNVVHLAAHHSGAPKGSIEARLAELEEQLEQQQMVNQDLRSRLDQASLFPPPGDVAPAGVGPVLNASNRVNGLEPGGFSQPTGFLADDETLADRIKKLESSRKKDEDSAKKKKEEDATKPGIKISGRIHTDYWGFPYVNPGVGSLEAPDGDPEDRFLFRRIRLGFSGDIADNMTYKMDVDFNNPATPQLKDVYFGWKDLVFLRTLLIGHQKRPYGLDHLNSSNANIYLERPYMVEAFNQDARRWGIASYGVSEDEAFNWRYGFYMGQDMQSTGVDTSTPNLEKFQGEFAGRFANTWWYDETSDGRGYGHWAVSSSFASPDGTDPLRNTARFQTRPEARTTNRWFDTGSIGAAENYELLGLEWVHNWGQFSAVAEYQQTWVQRNNADDLSFNGAYCYFSWVLTGEHHPWDRATGCLKPLKPYENFWLVKTCDGGSAMGWGAWEATVRFDYIDLTDGPIQGGIGRDVTLGMQWHWNQYCRLQYNFIVGEMTNRSLNNNGANDRNGRYNINGVRWIMYY